MDRPLTDRQQQILALRESGYTIREIGFQLDLADQTVKNHIHGAKKKRLGVWRTAKMPYRLRITRRTEGTYEQER
jgi:DNA-binding NarL/FixJ family response regulator